MREELEPRSVPLDDWLGVEPRRQSPERAEAVAGAERLCDPRVAVPVEERSLQRDRHRLDEAARALLRRVLEHRLHVRRVARLELAQERLGRRRLAAQRAEDVECLHVRRALPDRVQRALAEEAREAALLDEAVPAEAFERLADDGRARLQTQYLRTAVAIRRKPSSPSSKARASRSAETVAASDSTQRSARTFRISGWSTSGAPNAERWAA